LRRQKKSNFAVDPVSGEEIAEAVIELFRQDPTFISKLKDIIYK
jgi:hypothetical protein